MRLAPCEIVRVRRVADERGALTVVDEGALPFVVRRTFVISDVVSGALRGEHAHKLCDEAIQVFGSCVVRVDSGDEPVSFALASSEDVLIVRAGWWLQLSDFAPGTVCVVYCSRPYEPNDYLRDRSQYLEWVEANYAG